MCSIFLIKPQSYKTVVFAAKYQLKRVIVAILNCASFHSLCCLMNRKDKSLHKQYFYWNDKMFCVIKSYNTCSNAECRHWHSLTIILPLVYCTVHDTLFGRRPINPRFSCVKSLLLLWKPHSWFQATLKTFYRSQWRIDYMPKIISERCELVQLCDINYSGPVFRDICSLKLEW